jgi:hypothetical protein
VLAVLFDTCAAHRATITKTTAEKWVIELVFIPPGCTGNAGPLDRRIFDFLNAPAPQLSRAHYDKIQDGKTTCSMMEHNNIAVAWDRLIPNCSNSAWDICQM